MLRPTKFRNQYPYAVERDAFLPTVSKRSQLQPDPNGILLKRLFAREPEPLSGGQAIPVPGAEGM
jgi:hypothetical protein